MRHDLYSLAVCVVVLGSTAAVFAADEASDTLAAEPVTTTPEETPDPATVTTSTPDAAVKQTPATATSASTPKSPREQFEERVQKLREQERQRDWEAANRPTAWQLQNPSGEFNRVPTDKQLNGFVSPNTYYGPQFREWNQMSPPVYEQTLPFNMQSVPPITRTNVMVAPNTYRGSSNYRWNLTAPGGATPNALGGWTTRIGW